MALQEVHLDLALHLRFEEDMVAYSQCDFGGGENEQKKLQLYRKNHFSSLIERLKNSKYDLYKPFKL